MKSLTTEPRNSNRGSYCCPRRRSPRETSKLDSVNLLYGHDQNEMDNVKSSDSSEKRSRSKFYTLRFHYEFAVTARLSRVIASIILFRLRLQ